MLMKNYSEKILISGREFTQKEIENAIETVKLFPNLSRTELAKTLCVHLEWYTPSGNYKKHSARKFLEKLKDDGLVELPDLINTNPNPGLKPIEITSRTKKQKQLQGTVSDYSPIVLEKVKKIVIIKIKIFKLHYYQHLI